MRIMPTARGPARMEKVTTLTSQASSAAGIRIPRLSRNTSKLVWIHRPNCVSISFMVHRPSVKPRRQYGSIPVRERGVKLQIVGGFDQARTTSSKSVKRSNPSARIFSVESAELGGRAALRGGAVGARRTCAKESPRTRAISSVHMYRVPPRAPLTWKTPRWFSERRNAMASATSEIEVGKRIKVSSAWHADRGPSCRGIPEDRWAVGVRSGPGCAPRRHAHAARRGPRPPAWSARRNSQAGADRLPGRAERGRQRHSPN